MKKIKQISKTLPKVKSSEVAKALDAKYAGPVSKTGHKHKSILPKIEDLEVQKALSAAALDFYAKYVWFSPICPSYKYKHMKKELSKEQEMDITEFVSIQTYALTKFRDWWLTGNKKCPKIFIQKRLESSWQEELAMFKDTEGRYVGVRT